MSLVICKYRDSNMFCVWEPFPYLKCRNGSKYGIGMDCPELAKQQLFRDVHIC